MLGPSLLGRTVAFRPSPDPPGSWAVTLDDVALAELVWEDGGVRVDTPDVVGRVAVIGIDRNVGPWEGFDDEDGAGVLRIRRRIGEGTIWSEIVVTSDRAYAASAGPLVVIRGALRIVNPSRPWLSLTTAGVPERAVQREIARLDATDHCMGVA